MGLLTRSQIYLESLLQIVEDEIPEKRCTCHINPPCSDCVNWNLPRAVIDDAKKFIKELQAAQLINPDL